MNKKILFSPVGGTDPISETNCHDGPMLHIARRYKPDIIYLYMSKEILAKSEQDNRYLSCIEKLGEMMHHNFEVRLVKRPELINVQLFEPIYEDLENLLSDITDGLDDSDELLLNMSSGTPAMKSALLVIATMVEIPCKCIQVNTPEGKMNQHEHSETYPLEELWELNPDHSYKPEDKNYDRTHPETLISLKRLKYEEAIKKFVSAYNYHAALILAEEMRVEYTTAYIEKLRLADARQQMNFNQVDQLIKGKDAELYEIYSPIRTQGTRTVYEYMLTLQAKVARNEYVDFIRAISPIIADLFEEILASNTEFKLSDYTKSQNNVEVWNLDRLYMSKYEKILKKAYADFNGGWVKSDHLTKLMEDLISDSKILKCVTDLRKVESLARNMAAHNMVSVSDQWIKNKTGFTSSEIIKKLRNAFKYTSYHIKSGYWDSYDVMNKDIIDTI